MAIFHLNIKNISRGDGRSIVTAAAYRAGEPLPNEAEERLSDFSERRDFVAAEICLPDDALTWTSDRAKLWTVVEAAEKRKDARLGKEVEFALPRELPRALPIRPSCYEEGQDQNHSGRKEQTWPEEGHQIDGPEKHSAEQRIG